MTKTEIARLAILSLTDVSRFHVDPMNILRELGIDSKGAAEVHAALRADVMTAETGSQRWYGLRVIRAAVNSYARDASYR